MRAGVGWAWMALLAALLAGGRECRAERRCPWLNAATAAGFLGGEVQLTVTNGVSPGDVSCEFVRGAGENAPVLRIAVRTVAQPGVQAREELAAMVRECGGTAVALRGIGNEAMQCGAGDKVKRGEEQVVGRVRDQLFSIVAVRRAPLRLPAGGGLSAESRNIAEQVAGAMF